MIKKELLQVLACPKCKGKIKYAKNKVVNRRQRRQCIVCENCRLLYSMVYKDIPNMLVEDAEKY